eukprot:GFYU01002730.1.p1 GENE.GFYU01002730.1~~GFYU01002730.1.p1  ORF type:complete len:265 (-),score=9.96 GFYU01002730.1:16-810(-)
MAAEFPAWAQRPLVRSSILLGGLTLFLVFLCVAVAVTDTYNGPIFDMDVSGYGFYGEAGYVPFLLAFVTGLPLMATGVWLRLIQLGNEAKFQTSFIHALALLSMVAAAVVLTIMAISNNNPSGQSVHFPCALIGMGSLAFFELVHAVYSVAVLWGIAREHGVGVLTSTAVMIIRTVSAVAYVILPCLVPLFVWMWIGRDDGYELVYHPETGEYTRQYITESPSKYEWAAVICLFVYFVPLAIELGQRFGKRPANDSASSALLPQ